MKPRTTTNTSNTQGKMIDFFSSKKKTSNENRIDIESDDDSDYQEKPKTKK